MKEIQTPQKMYAGSAEKRNRRLKHFPNSNPAKHHPITKKRLSAAFSSVSEDSSNFSPISKISDANHNKDVITLSLEEASTENLLLSDTISSKKTTEESGISSTVTDCSGAYELDSAMFTFSDEEIAENSVRNIQPPLVRNSIVADDPQYRKLIDEITKHVMEELYGCIQPEDSNRIDRVLHAKNRTLFLCLCIWIFVVLAVFFFISDIHHPPSGQVPT